MPQMSPMSWPILTTSMIMIFLNIFSKNQMTLKMNKMMEKIFMLTKSWTW